MSFPLMISGIAELSLSLKDICKKTQLPKYKSTYQTAVNIVCKTMIMIYIKITINQRFIGVILQMSNG